MIYHLAHYLTSFYSGFNVIHYISFRAIASLITALVLSLFFGQLFIEKSKLLFSAQTREYTPKSHKNKGIMPTVGGVFILGVVIITSLLWSNLTHFEVWVFLLCLLLFGIIGFCDDWYKIRKKKGISEKTKFYAQLLAGVLIVNAWIFFCAGSTQVWIPCFKNIHPYLGWFFIPWAVLVIVGTSNAVNLTDGLDGLATGSLIANFSTFSIIAYLASHAIIAHYLHIPYAATGEVAILGATLVGACLGFLWYNAYPAQIFMGDVGSLSLGAALGFMAIMTKQELLLPLSGGLFVVETVSVILQVLSYKFRKKRLFKMAPIHHHFELLGWPESKITIRFSIITLILCLISLLTLKIR